MLLLDLFTKSLHEKDGYEVLSRKVFKFGDKEILVRIRTDSFAFPALASTRIIKLLSS
jgi:hypothetical protein